jgi:hypothetical protein
VRSGVIRNLIAVNIYFENHGTGETSSDRYKPSNLSGSIYLPHADVVGICEVVFGKSFVASGIMECSLAMNSLLEG